LRFLVNRLCLYYFCEAVVGGNDTGNNCGGMSFRNFCGKESVEKFQKLIGREGYYSTVLLFLVLFWSTGEGH
jgi:hypothetical protein